MRIEAYEFLFLPVLAARGRARSNLPAHRDHRVRHAAARKSFSATSNALRGAATTVLFTSWFIADVDTMRYACVFALELASWATERSMLPWRVREAQTWDSPVVRFFLGFVVGVHMSDATDEHVHPFPFRRVPTIVGVAVHENRVFLRYRATPLGILLAYLEGIFARLIHGIVCRDTITFQFTASFLSSRGPLTSEHACSSHESFACASRFPVRRIVLGILLRIASNISITL